MRLSVAGDTTSTMTSVKAYRIITDVSVSSGTAPQAYGDGKLSFAEGALAVPKNEYEEECLETLVLHGHAEAEDHDIQSLTDMGLMPEPTPEPEDTDDAPEDEELNDDGA